MSIFVVARLHHQTNSLGFDQIGGHVKKVNIFIYITM
jgi:hypothetical protein